MSLPGGGAICDPAPTVPTLNVPVPSIVASPRTTRRPSDSAAKGAATKFPLVCSDTKLTVKTTRLSANARSPRP
jgi:hypothetical protein